MQNAILSRAVSLRSRGMYFLSPAFSYLFAGCILISFSKTYYVALLIKNVLLRLGLGQEIPRHYHSSGAACSFIIEAIGYNLSD
jgi:hypothetical protein